MLLASSGSLRHEVVGGGPGAPEPPWPAALRTSFRSLQASVQLGARHTSPGATAGAPPAEAPLVNWLLTLAQPQPQPPTLALALAQAQAQAQP